MAVILVFSPNTERFSHLHYSSLKLPHINSIMSAVRRAIAKFRILKDLVLILCR